MKFLENAATHFTNANATKQRLESDSFKNRECNQVFSNFEEF